GMQAHYQSGTSIGSVKYSIELFESIPDIEISMTELDVTVEAANGKASLTKKQEIEQAVFYAKLFKLYKEHSDRIARVTFWGLNDNASWRKEKFPCLFNKDFTPKEAVYACLDPDTYLDLHATGYGDNRNRAEAKYGTPKVDGAPDELYNDCTEYQVNTMLTAWNGASATMKLLWDEEYLYVFLDVKDKYLSSSNRNAYEQDSVELFIDQKNNRTSYYEEDDGHFRVNYKGDLTYGDNMINDALKNGFIGKAISVGGGYYVEAAIPWTVEAKEGLIVGFDAQVNDTNTGGSRESIAKFNDPSDSSWQSTEGFGEVILKK
ncbi:MAG: endo-1,4-beta-xylanase, partial [Lachnospiraceae bacterium]|nr:endo-1,4-beta-xylanase [Lachnospiraceae bacterium]